MTTEGLRRSIFYCEIKKKKNNREGLLRNFKFHNRIKDSTEKKKRKEKRKSHTQWLN